MSRHLKLFWILTSAFFVIGACATSSQLYAEQASTAPVTVAQAREPQPGAQQYPGQQLPGQPPSPSSRPPEPSGRQAPDTEAGQTQGVQTFTGVIVQSGNKYVLQDESRGTIYDVDHQDEVAKHAGKRVRLHGTLDSSGKMIHIQAANR
jgi:hypothetical protein